jgi:hypothetical protein
MKYKFGKGSLPLSELKVKLLPRKRQDESLVFGFKNRNSIATIGAITKKPHPTIS